MILHCYSKCFSASLDSYKILFQHYEFLPLFSSEFCLQFRHTIKKRTKDSAIEYAKGAFPGEEFNIPEALEKDKVLRVGCSFIHSFIYSFIHIMFVAERGTTVICEN